VRLIVDASVAVRWFAPLPLRQEARAVLLGEDELVAPDLVFPETCNVAWKLFRQNQLQHAQALAIGDRLGQAFDSVVPSSALTRRALAVALDLAHPAYDAFYLACAERFRGLLLTTDQRLLRALQGTEFAGLAIHLTELDARP